MVDSVAIYKYKVNIVAVK